MNAKKSLYWQFLSIIIPLVVLVFIALISFYEWMNFNKDRHDLILKLDNLTSTYSLLLAEPVASNNIKDLQLYNIALIADSDVDFVVIKNASGVVLVQYGDVSDDLSLQRTLSINYSLDEKIEKVGEFTIGLSTQNIISNFVDRVKYESILLISLITIVLFAVRLGYVETIGKPLAALMSSIDYFKKNRKHLHVKYEHEDELGAVITRFNDMQVHQLAIQQELKKQHFSLEHIVAERTQELEHELKKHAETSSKLYNEKQRAQITINSISDSVVTTDENGMIEFMNPAAYTLLDYKKAFADGKYFSDIFHLLSIESRDPVTDLVSWCLESESKRCPPIEFYLKLESGKEYIVEAILSGLFDVKGNANGAVILIRDITASKERSNELSYLARHDMLTGLVNRREFESQMQHLLEDACLNERQHVMFYLDLDHFKIVNDECGHAAGDKVLKLLAEEFKKHLRKDDCIGRLGGDEFGVLLVNCSVKSAQKVGEKMRHDIDNFEFEWQGRKFKLGVSIGVVAITQHADSIESLIGQADTSCYIAKQKGRNRIHLHTVN
ncbi:MAG: diguanylate cyclase [Gammaproteobacteria bacterium]|nr:diguanylate cyclase [Gammaproteobacteria bacterium]